MPEVSVIIPIFNRRGVFRRCLDSVLEQVGVDFELIVVDDASTQPDLESYERVKEAGHTVVRLSENRGPGACRNRGAEAAAGEWLSFLDSDDHWLPHKLARHLASLKRSGLPVGQTEEIWYRDGVRVNPPKAHKISGGDLFRRSLRAVCVSSSTVMLKRELFFGMGQFDERLFVCEDYDMWLRVASEVEFAHLAEPLVVKYGGHDDQLSKALPAMDRFRIFAILKLLRNAGLSQPQRELAVFEALRKLRILAKGSAKRDKTKAVSLCREISALVEAQAWDNALHLGNELIACWDQSPS